MHGRVTSSSRSSAELTAWLIKKWLGITVAVPLFVWAVLFSVIFGFVITNFTLKVFFDPVAKLEKAMAHRGGQGTLM